MSLVLLRYLAMTFGPSIAATARPATAFLVIQLTVIGLVNQEMATVPVAFEGLLSMPIVGVVAILALLETAAAHDPDISTLLRDFNVDRVTGAFGALGCALLFVALGMPESVASAMVDGPADVVTASGGILDAAGEAAATEHSTGIQTLVVGLAVALNLGLVWLRSQLLLFIYEFELGKLWARIETGGVVGLLILLPFFPLIIFGVLVLLACAMAALALAARTASHIIDRRSRIPCEGCGEKIRVESSLCPKCGAKRQPTAAPSTGLKAAINALRER